MLSERGLARVAETGSSSYVCDVKKWPGIMQAFENEGHAYHATMPTDSLLVFHDTLIENKNYGFEVVRKEQIGIGKPVRSLPENRGFLSVAADGFKAPSVVVSFTDDDDIKNSSKLPRRVCKLPQVRHFNAAKRQILRASVSGFFAQTSYIKTALGQKI